MDAELLMKVLGNPEIADYFGTSFRACYYRIRNLFPYLIAYYSSMVQNDCFSVPFSKQVKLQNASNITKEIAEAGYRLYKDNDRLPADDKELKSSRLEFFQKPLEPSFL